MLNWSRVAGVLFLGIVVAGGSVVILRVIELKDRIEIVESSAPYPLNPTQKMVESELQSLQKQVEEVSSFASRSRSSGSLDEIRSRLEEVRRQADLLSMAKGREERLLDIAAQAASQSVGTASGVISFLTILFTVVVLGLSLVSGLHFREFGAQLERDKLAAESAIREVRTQRDDAIKDLERLRSDLRGVESESSRQLAEIAERVRDWKEESKKELRQVHSISHELDVKSHLIGTFLDRLVSIHAAAFSEILGSLPLGMVFSEEEGQRVRLKGQELKGRLLLWHPNLAQRKSAVMLLGAVGTKVVVADLRRLQGECEEKEIALLIESAIGKINARS